MSGPREFVKRILPARFVAWYRGRRIRILEAAGGATRITPKLVARVGWNKTAPARTAVRAGVVKVTPKPIVTRRRRKRVWKKYTKALSYELLERETQLDYIEGRVAARRDGFYERIVREVLERTEMILQELDRRIEGVSARGGERMNAIEEQLFQLREEISRLRQLSDPGLEGLGARARAEVGEVPSAEDAEPEVAEAESAEPETAEAPVDAVAAEPDPVDAAANGSGNGRPAPAPAERAATGAE